MILLGFCILLLMGMLVVRTVSHRFSLAEQIGLAFPVGLGIQTLLMALINLCRLRLTAWSVLAAALLLVSVFLWWRRPAFRARPAGPLPGLCLTGCNAVWLLFMFLIAYFEYMNVTKCLYFPTFDRDSLTGFDTIGYTIAREHTFRGLSFFRADYMPHIHDAGSYITYAPLTQLSYAFVYLLGAETSKLVPACMYLFFLVAFYGVMRRVVCRTCAAVGTFLLMITPELMAFSSLSATNVIHAVFASLGILYVSLWFRERHRRDLLMGSLLLGFNVWTRTDGVVFLLAAVLVVGIDALRRRCWRPLLPVLCAFLPLLFWALFCRMSGFYSESIAILHLFWDAEKLRTILRGFQALCLDTQLFGISFLFFAFTLPFNGWFTWRRRDNAALLCLIALSLLAYMALLYQIDYKWDSIYNVLTHSAKRFLFCFLPLAWFYALSGRGIARLFLWLEERLG